MAEQPAWNLEQFRFHLRILARGLLRDWPQLHQRIDQSDLAHDVLLKAHASLGQFRGTTEDDLLRWLRAILANEFHDVCRREFAQQRDPGREQSINASLTRSSVRLGAFLEATSQASPSEQAQQHEAQLALARALESLPADECEMLVAHEMEGESYKQIAGRLGVSAGTVFNRVTAAKRKLMALLEGHGSGGG